MVLLQSLQKRPLLPSGPYSRVRDLLYAKFILLLLKNEEVGKSGCKLSGYMWGQFASNTNPSTVSGKISFVLTLPIKTTLWNSKHSSIQELNEPSHACLWPDSLTRAIFWLAHQKQSGHWFKWLSHSHVADSNAYRIRKPLIIVSCQRHFSPALGQKSL